MEVARGQLGEMRRKPGRTCRSLSVDLRPAGKHQDSRDVRAARTATQPTSLGQQRLDVGRLGNQGGIYTQCSVEAVYCHALVDTGSTVIFIQPEILPNTKGRKPPGWTVTEV